MLTLKIPFFHRSPSTALLSNCIVLFCFAKAKAQVELDGLSLAVSKAEAVDLYKLKAFIW